MKKNETLSEDAKKKTELLTALLQEPTTYHITVMNNEGLPDNLAKKKEISFEIKPPVMATLSKVGKIVNSIDDDVFDTKKGNAHLLKYSNKMCEMIAILAHGNSKKKMPSWYLVFLANNLTPEETLMIFQEATMKLKTDFFLPCFQTARANPLMMMEQRVKRLKK